MFPIFPNSGKLSNASQSIYRRLAFYLAIATTSCALSVFLFSSSANAQKYNPEHPVVKDMAWKAVRALGNQGGGGGRTTLKALAIVECYKRYEGVVPSDHPLVSTTVAAIVNEINSDGKILHHKDLYYPCLATILLMEVDDAKYKNQIITMMNMLRDRQLSNGGFAYLSVGSGGETGAPDTSQSQYAALVYFVARQHRFNFDPSQAGRLLQFFVDFQAGNGSWDYNPRRGTQSAKPSLSIHSASLSSVYLLGDLLQLQPRKKTMAKALSKDNGLPPSVTIYVPPKAGGERSWDQTGPIVPFNMGAFRDCKGKGNNFFERAFQFPEGQWNEYYMYAFERYAFFREQAESNVGRNRMRRWYDEGVEYYIPRQQDNGMFEKGLVPNMPADVTTPLAIMFLVRSSEVLSQPPADSELLGGLGFEEDAEITVDRGTLQSSKAQKSLSELLAALQDDNLSSSQLQTLTDSMKRAVQDFKSTPNRSKSEIKSFLVNMIGAKNYFRRKVAVRLLAGEQDMDNVPALLYALGDPDLRIAEEAHNGLRLVSRKIDTFNYVETGTKEEKLTQMLSLKEKWTEWYLKIRPDADLFD